MQFSSRLKLSRAHGSAAWPAEIVKGSGVVMEQWHTVTQPTNNGVEKREDTKASVQLKPLPNASSNLL